MNRIAKFSVLTAALVGLAGCGFHLRKAVAVAPEMQHLYIDGNGDLQRHLEQSLLASGVAIEDHAGTGIAQMQIPVSQFSTDSLTFNGSAQVTEYAVHYHVEFSINDGAGKILLPQQSIEMSREFSNDATDPVGNAAEVEEIQRSLTDDMVQAILFRLRAANKKLTTGSAPAAARSGG